MIIQALAGLATILLTTFGIFTRPTKATCPGRSWYLDSGVRPSGIYRCAPPLIEPVGDYGGNDVQPAPGHIYGQVYCTGGARAIVVDHRRVGCQR